MSPFDKWFQEDMHEAGDRGFNKANLRMAFDAGAKMVNKAHKPRIKDGQTRLDAIRTALRYYAYPSRWYRVAPGNMWSVEKTLFDEDVWASAQFGHEKPPPHAKGGFEPAAEALKLADQLEDAEQALQHVIAAWDKIPRGPVGHMAPMPVLELWLINEMAVAIVRAKARLKGMA